MTLGIDLGTASVRVVVPGKGVVLNQPCVLALDEASGDTRAVGEAARILIGRQPPGVRVVAPLERGVIADPGAACSMLSHLFSQVLGWRKVLHPKVFVAVPGRATATERKAFLAVLKAAGAGKVVPVESPLAAAESSGSREGAVIVDIGAGSTQVSLLSPSGVAAVTQLPVGGQAMDQAIARDLRQRRGLEISVDQAEEARIAIGSALLSDNPKTWTFRGRDSDGLPRSMEVSAEEIHLALRGPLEKIGDAVRVTLHRVPPAMAAEVVERGLILAGGGALLTGLEPYLRELTGLPVRLAPEPQSCVALGTLKGAA